MKISTIQSYQSETRYGVFTIEYTTLDRLMNGSNTVERIWWRPTEDYGVKEFLIGCSVNTDAESSAKLILESLSQCNLRNPHEFHAGLVWSLLMDKAKNNELTLQHAEILEKMASDFASYGHYCNDDDCELS